MKAAAKRFICIGFLFQNLPLQPKATHLHRKIRISTFCCRTCNFPLCYITDQSKTPCSTSQNEDCSMTRWLLICIFCILASSPPKKAKHAFWLRPHSRLSGLCERSKIPDHSLLQRSIPRNWQIESMLRRTCSHKTLRLLLCSDFGNSVRKYNHGSRRTSGT